jgi:hypothetical protein
MSSQDTMIYSPRHTSRWETQRGETVVVSILALACTVSALVTGVAGLRDTMRERKTPPPLLQKSSSICPSFIWFAVVAMCAWLAVVR